MGAHPQSLPHKLKDHLDSEAFLGPTEIDTTLLLCLAFIRLHGIYLFAGLRTPLKFISGRLCLARLFSTQVLEYIRFWITIILSNPISVGICGDTNIHLQNYSSPLVSQFFDLLYSNDCDLSPLSPKVISLILSFTKKYTPSVVLITGIPSVITTPVFAAESN